MENARKWTALWPYLLLVLTGISAYFLTTLAIPEGKTITRDEDEVPSRPSYPLPEEPVKHRKVEREKRSLLDTRATDAGAIPNKRVIVFKDRDALEAFLAKLGNGVNLLGRLDKLNALLVGFDTEYDLLATLDGTEETSYIFPISIPECGEIEPQSGLVAVGSNLLEWLGVTGDNSMWGTGIRVAILDTGIADHIAFKNAIQRINLVALSEDPAALNGHGTAVATLIFSNNPFAPGIAPGATPISVRIADDNGGSNSFLIAQGIIAAVDAGAQLINISLGGTGQSSLVDSAVAYAKAHGALIIASSGNTGREGVMQPAANLDVLGVGAVDAANRYLNFSTTGSEVALAAAGYGVNVAYPGDKAAQVSGTSFSAPAVTGTLAATMSSGGSHTLTTTQAFTLMNSNLNDIGAQGPDNRTGAGVPDMWRIQNSGTAGIYDAAVTSITTSGNQVQVLVQNQGTSALINTSVSVSVNGSVTTANITTLAVGESRVVTVPVGGTEGLKIRGSVRLSSGQTDQRPSNDSISQSSAP